MPHNLNLLAAAVAAALAAGLWLAGGDAPRGPIQGGLRGLAARLDVLSFMAGVAATLAGVGLARLPWSTFSDVLSALLRTWRRNFVLAGLAAVCTGILLFY